MSDSITGTVKRLVKDKGFGFILAKDGNEYFLHRTAMDRGRFDQLTEGEEVEFLPADGPKGLRAERAW